jgi:hypothetical protein
MNKKRVVLLSGALLTMLLLAGLVGVTAVLAQEPPPEGEASTGLLGFGRGRGIFGWFGGGSQWTMFDTAADTLGLTPEELFDQIRLQTARAAGTEMHEGKSLEEIAEEQGVDIEEIQDAINAARGEAMQEAIEQAVEDGTMSQEQADWLIEGLEQGFLPGGRGLGFERGRGRPGGRWRCPEDE